MGVGGSIWVSNDAEQRVNAAGEHGELTSGGRVETIDASGVVSGQTTKGEEGAGGILRVNERCPSLSHLLLLRCPNMASKGHHQVYV
jgi:hypothetical protein